MAHSTARTLHRSRSLAQECQTLAGELSSVFVNEIIRKAFEAPKEFADLCAKAGAERRAQTRAGVPVPAEQGVFEDILRPHSTLAAVLKLKGISCSSLNTPAREGEPAPRAFMDYARELASEQGRVQL